MIKKIPLLVAEKDLKQGALIDTLHKLNVDSASSLIKAARLYQDAVWLGESEPELTWLLLASAVETAAGFWRKASDSPVDRLLVSRPKLGQILREAGGEALLQRVADEMADYMGATKKFIDFLIAFCPSPPSERTHLSLQLSWEISDLRKALRQIYRWRSQALHGGTPFPPNMSDPPTHFEEFGYSELPLGLATRIGDSTWSSKDTPMLLHVFEYLVRGSLTNWWRSLVS